jgi:hypothetical protein
LDDSIGDSTLRLHNFLKAFYRLFLRCRLPITEEFEESGGEEGIAEFEGVSAHPAHPVRFLQLLRYSMLLRKGGKSNLNVFQNAMAQNSVAPSRLRGG